MSARSDGSVMFDHANGYLSPASVMDAEEFFQAKRDAELGRWRWPENPDYVVYVDGDRVAVVDERNGDRTHYLRSLCASTPAPIAPDGHHAAAHAYYEAHPERPAAEAKVGEIWELVIDDGSEHTVFIHADLTMGGRDGVSAGGAYFDIDAASNITSARKVWGPEDAA